MVAGRKNPNEQPYYDEDMFTANRIAKMIGATYRQKAINLIKKGELMGAFVRGENAYMATYRNIMDFLEKRQKLLNGGESSQPSLPLQEVRAKKTQKGTKNARPHKTKRP